VSKMANKKLIIRNLRFGLAHPISVFCIIITSFIIPIDYRLRLIIILFLVTFNYYIIFSK